VITFDGNHFEQLNSEQPLPSCEMFRLTFKSLHHNHTQTYRLLLR